MAPGTGSSIHLHNPLHQLFIRCFIIIIIKLWLFLMNSSFLRKNNNNKAFFLTALGAEFKGEPLNFDLSFTKKKKKKFVRTLSNALLVLYLYHYQPTLKLEKKKKKTTSHSYFVGNHVWLLCHGSRIRSRKA